jgi:hypothetical protein
MMKSKVLAAVLAGTLVFSSMHASTAGVIAPPPPAAATGASNALAVWLVFGCAGSVMLAALVASQRDNRELVTAEAATCGLLFWLDGRRRR